MSRSHSAPTRQLTCTDVRFVQVEFPRQLQPRLVVEFSDGLSLLLEDQTAIGEIFLSVKSLESQRAG